MPFKPRCPNRTGGVSVASREPQRLCWGSTLYVICRANSSAPGRIRTCDRRIRSPLLCPLSYGRIRLMYAE